jgi:hypothetical protein
MMSPFVIYQNRTAGKTMHPYVDRLVGDTELSISELIVHKLFERKPYLQPWKTKYFAGIPMTQSIGFTRAKRAQILCCASKKFVAPRRSSP